MATVVVPTVNPQPHPPSSTDRAPLFLFRPFAAAGRGFFAFAAYLGSAKLLALSACRTLIRTPEDSRSVPLRGACLEQLSWMLRAGLPLAILINASLGGLLAMQAYYGATFVQAAGPVVLIGMFRNGAPLLSCFILAGLISARIASEFAIEGWRRSPSRLAAERILAAMIAGAILNLVGALAGTALGAIAAKRYLGVPFQIFLENGWSMIWLRDIVSLALKGFLYGGIAALFACLEGLRLPNESEPGTTLPYRACARACGFAVLTIFFLNSAWFILMYKSGPPFGPTVLKPPIP